MKHVKLIVLAVTTAIFASGVNYAWADGVKITVLRPQPLGRVQHSLERQGASIPEALTNHLERVVKSGQPKPGPMNLQQNMHGYFFETPKGTKGYVYGCIGRPKIQHHRAAVYVRVLSPEGGRHYTRFVLKDKEKVESTVDEVRRILEIMTDDNDQYRSIVKLIVGQIRSSGVATEDHAKPEPTRGGSAQRQRMVPYR